MLIQGFNTFLPPGYRIECGTEDNPDAIRVTTPSGTNTLSMTRPRASLDSAGEMGPSSGLVPSGRVEYYDQSRGSWQQAQPQQQGGMAGSYSPSNRVMGGGLYGQPPAQSQLQDHHYDYQSQQEQQASATAAALHQQEQRGVSQLQSAVAATAGAGRPSLLQASPGSGSAAGPNQPMNSLAGIGSGVLQGSQADLNKRGPVEFNHAISYVNKIKVSTIRASPIRGPVILTYYIYPTESVCQRSRDLQAVSRDLADLSAGI